MSLLGYEGRQSGPTVHMSNHYTMKKKTESLPVKLFNTNVLYICRMAVRPILKTTLHISLSSPHVGILGFNSCATPQVYVMKQCVTFLGHKCE